MKFTFEEDRPTVGDVTDDRRKLVAVPFGGSGSRALAIPMGGIFIDAERNFADEFEEELNLQAADILEDVPDDEADLRVLKRIYEKNPQLLAKFLASIGL